MATVPYAPVQSEVSSAIPTPEVRVDAPREAFGGSIAEAQQSFGRGISRAGDELFQRAMAIQQVNNEAEAKQADSDYAIQAGKVHAEYNSLQGKEAVDGYPAYASKLQELRIGLRKTLSNDAVRRMYDSGSLSVLNRSVFNGAGHAASQQRQYAAGASAARIETVKNAVLHNPDDGTTDDALHTVEREVRGTQANIAGWSPEKTDSVVAQETSSVLAARIRGVAKTDPFKASHMLELYKDKLYYDDLEKVTNLVQSNTHTVGARNISADINKDLYDNSKGKPPEIGLEERVNAGVDRAKKMFPNDDLMPDYVANRIRADYTSRKKDIKDTQDDYRTTLASAMNGDMNPNKPLPTTIEEIKALSPDVSAAWDNLDPKLKSAYIKGLAANAKGDYPKTEQTFKDYHRLLGMSQSDDDKTRNEFFEKNLMEEKLPREFRTALIKRQEAMRHDISANPAVNSAMTMLSDAGIAPPKTDKDSRDRFRGALQIALEEYQGDAKKKPGIKEIREIGSRLIQEQADPTKFNIGIPFTNMWTSRTTPIYQQDVPNERLEKIKSQLEKSGITMSDDMIKRQYFRETYQKMYGKSKSE